MGKTEFNRKIFAVEKITDVCNSTAILVAGVHAREHITTDLVLKMFEEGLFDEIQGFNIVAVPMANPDGVELETGGIGSAPKRMRKKLIEANGNSLDFLMWKANGRGVDINNNFDANFGQNTSAAKPAPQGYAGRRAESERESKVLVRLVKKTKPFITLSYHSKGEEIYFNFFQEKRELERDSVIAKKFACSTGYKIKNPERTSSGGFKDYCVSKLKIPALTIEVGSDSLSHPILSDRLDEIFEKHKSVATDLEFAYNVFEDYENV